LNEAGPAGIFVYADGSGSAFTFAVLWTTQNFTPERIACSGPGKILRQKDRCGENLL
jgi:hypothetical protein